MPAALSRSCSRAARRTGEEEEAVREEQRRKAEAARLKNEGPKVPDGAAPLGKAAGKGRALALGLVGKTAQDRREEEARGMTPEMRMRLERERRARAAEERIRRMAGGS